MKNPYTAPKKREAYQLIKEQATNKKPGFTIAEDVCRQTGVDLITCNRMVAAIRRKLK